MKPKGFANSLYETFWFHVNLQMHSTIRKRAVSQAAALRHDAPNVFDYRNKRGFEPLPRLLFIVLLAFARAVTAFERFLVTELLVPRVRLFRRTRGFRVALRRRTRRVGTIAGGTAVGGGGAAGIATVSVTISAETGDASTGTPSVDGISVLGVSATVTSSLGVSAASSVASVAAAAAVSVSSAVVESASDVCWTSSLASKSISSLYPSTYSISTSSTLSHLTISSSRSI